ncbi:MAG TPA: adenine nucleotide alpha hydrolase [Anaerolineae bacterium]|nr:adenine nucleotide alpha hydrolase [Anaerolineae bacterium]HPL28273.1 adenine nucleotide alpha hydrolase [Anaerolineae bacterium]
MEQVLLSWSAGKDSALALYEILKDPAYRVQALLTTVTEDYDRVSMHGIRRSLLERQARALGLPLEVVRIPAHGSNDGYEARMAKALARHQARGVTAVAFGDTSLEEVRAYRERNLARAGLRGVFPLWGRDARALVRSFIRLGFRAITTCVDTQALDARLAGRPVDERFLAELPANVDPCGENGEYHSFVCDGPIFSVPVAYTVGGTVLREGRFAYCDLLPAWGTGCAA